MSIRLRARVVVQPGLEPYADAELQRLGIRGNAKHGGVDATMTVAQMLQCHLWLRTATRVLVRLGEFGAANWDALERGIGELDWEPFLASDYVRVRADSHGSKLFHTGAVEERGAAAIEAATGAVSPADGVDDAGVLTVRIRIANDRATVSVDASGPSLYHRGYRLDVAKAPLRESIAAAVVMASGWDGRRPLVDPMCGSGTIAIEAAMIAQRRAPGRHLSPACASWPLVGAGEWDRLRRAADADVIDRRVVIIGRDRDRGAIEAATANAARAAVDVEFAEAALSEPFGDRVTAGRHWLVTNPPYGERLGRTMDLRNLYDSLARHCTAPNARWAIVAPSGPLLARLGPQQLLCHTENGGIPVSFSTGAPATP